jgi:hypothetical protein
METSITHPKNEQNLGMFHNHLLKTLFDLGLDDFTKKWRKCYEDQLH